MFPFLFLHVILRGILQPPYSHSLPYPWKPGLINYLGPHITPNTETPKLYTPFVTPCAFLEPGGLGLFEEVPGCRDPNDSK